MTLAEHPFSIEIFFPDGNPSSYRTITKDGWAGIGVICPKFIFPQKKKEEVFANPAVYVLIGNSDVSGKLKIYIGEADPVAQRLESHYVNKDFWTKAILFTSGDNKLNKAHIKYLESRLVQLAREADQSDVSNGTTPNLPSLSSKDAAYAEHFLQEMLHCYSAIGIKIFEKPNENKNTQNATILYMNSRNVKATGYETEDGFIVCKGSQAVIKETASLNDRAKAIRASLLAEGVFKEDNGVYIFTRDCQLNSPSNASNIVQAASSDGLRLWQNQNGVSLKSIREQESEI